MKRRKSAALVLLAPSKTHGVGCFTDHDISRGELVKCWDGKDSRWIPEKKAHASPQVALIKRFGIRVRGGYWAPTDFLRMSAGWYMNHSATPNLLSDDGEVTYYAARDIKAGEELTIDYRRMDEHFDNLTRDEVVPAKGRHRASRPLRPSATSPDVRTGEIVHRCSETW
jgi:SET domain-containing protein